MLQQEINVKTKYFDGPLSLLLHLVQKEEMDINKLDISIITKQYIIYVSQMSDLDFDVAGEYLYLAATLILLKSKKCLNEEDTKQLTQLASNSLKITSEVDLIARLEELQKYQSLSQKLLNLTILGRDNFDKPKIKRKEIVNSILTPLDLASLTNSMIDLIFRDSRKYKVVKRDRLSIKEKLIFLKQILKLNQQYNFQTLLENSKEKSSLDNKVITFISLLELARLNKISINQEDDNEEILINIINSLADFNVDIAQGFEDETN